MRESLVSVIVPIYNVELYLERCIKSIINQTYRNLEIILVDDGSPDRCPQICDEWCAKDERVKVIHKDNAGLGMARNTGIEHATGEYVYFVDSDDYIDNDTIEQVLNCAVKYSAEIVLFGRKRVNNRGEIVSVQVPKTFKTVYRGREVQQLLLPDVIQGNCKDSVLENLSLHSCTAFFSMELIKRCNWRFISERENISEDTHSFIMLYRYANNVAIIEKAFYNHFQNFTSLTQTFRKDRIEKISKSYIQTRELAKLFENSRVIEKRIAAVYSGFVIAAMKQIVASRTSFNKKYRAVAIAVKDKTINDITQNCGQFNGKAKNIIIWSIKRKLVLPCYVLLLLKVTKEGN